MYVAEYTIKEMDPEAQVERLEIPRGSALPHSGDRNKPAAAAPEGGRYPGDCRSQDPADRRSLRCRTEGDFPGAVV